ncbi:MAG TPA: hypothetical protein VGO47_04740 [Chlamydiales bacterium]|nr:hypothetical protein [Chlamydiales bacterium]
MTSETSVRRHVLERVLEYSKEGTDRWTLVIVLIQERMVQSVEGVNIWSEFQSPQSSKLAHETDTILFGQQTGFQVNLPLQRYPENKRQK